MNPTPTKPRRNRFRILTIIWLSLTAWHAFGQTPNEAQTLKPDQNIEREMTGAETHRYQFDLQRGEFFQVRVEQKGVDVALKLLDAGGNALAMMDSPNGIEGFETLSFVADKADNFILEVSGLDAKAQKAVYAVKREAARQATQQDKRRMEVERLFVEGIKAKDTEGQAEPAIKKLEEALKGWQELGDSYLIDLTGKNLTNLKENKYNATFIKLYQELQKATDILREGEKLTYKSKTDSISAREKLNEGLVLYRALSAKVNNKDFVEKMQQSSELSSKPLDLLRNLQYYVKSGENSCLERIAQTYYNLGEWQGYIDYKNLAIVGYRAIIEDKNLVTVIDTKSLFQIKLLEVMALKEVGDSLEDYFGKTEESLNYLSQSLELSRKLYNETQNQQAKLKEADILIKIGFIYGKQSRSNSKSIESFTRALKIYQTFPDRKNNEGEVLSFIAVRYMLNFQYDEAKKNFDIALQIFQDTNNKWAQSNILQSLAAMSVVLNNKPETVKYVDRNLLILQSPDYFKNYQEHFEKNSGSLENFEVYKEKIKSFIEYQRLSAIGQSYRWLENYSKALEFYEKTLAVARERKEPIDIKLSLFDVGYTLGKLEKWNEAASYYLQEVAVSRELGNREDIASSLQDVGAALLESGKPQEALKYQNDALSYYQSVGVGENKAFTPIYSGLLNEISQTHYALGNKRLAIFYGKRAVNAIQGERQRLQNLDAASQKGFLEKKEKHYRRFAEWLIEEGKFAQAEQVLAMLKEEEYFDFVRRDAGEIGKLDARVPLNDTEKALIARYSLLADKITKIGQEFTKLDDKKRTLSRNDLSLSAGDQKRYTELEKQLDTANAAFQLFLTKELVAEIGAEKTKDIEIDRNLQDKIIKWGNGTVALYTVAGADRYRVVLTTPTSQFAGKYEIKIADLNEKIFAFRAALQNPNVDPRPLGKELYDILIKPVEKELKAAHAKTLVWSLDGTLRYIPLAALSPDGVKYLVEDMRNVVITKFTSGEESAVNPDWRALGLGVSEAETVTNPDDTARSLSFNPLPGTERELLAIVKDEKSKIETGVLSGKRYINQDFTTAAFKDALAKETADGARRYNVIHIASHFRLGSNESNSFILLGNGGILTLAEIRNSPTIDFGSVELITLSACNTGFADDSDGKEIDSLAEVIQKKSGKAVLATLWAVADDSTSLLMSKFYRLRKEKPQISKADAIQAAQQAMIRGAYKTIAEAQANRSEIVNLNGEKSTQPPYKKDQKTPYAHPYYWSPFVLIGNWK